MSFGALVLAAAWLGLGAPSVPAADVLTPCFLKVALYTGIPGPSVAELQADPRYPASPTEVRYLRSLNTRDALPTDELEDYGARIEGYLTPLESGEYHFFLRSTEASELWLGTDDTEGSATLLAQELDYGDPFQEPEVGDAATSPPVTLVAGQRYFLMVLSKGSSGAGRTTDYAQVAWRRVGDPTPAAQLHPIPAAFLSTMAPAATDAGLQVTTQPTSLTAAANSRATFTVAAEVPSAVPVCIQWQRNGVNIPGATGAEYTRFVDAADHGAKFRAVIAVPGAYVLSEEAAVTVTPDTTPPAWVGAVGGPNRPEVTLTFSERVTAATATVTGNYQIRGPGGAALAITDAVLSKDQTQVVLTTAAQAIGTRYSVTASGITDLATPSGNVIDPQAEVTFEALGPWEQTTDGFVVWEAEDYDRNLDGLWSVDAERGVASGGRSMVIANGAGGSETATILEYDILFTRTGTHYLWYRCSANDGNDDSVWLLLDGVRPPGREAGNLAAMSGFNSSLQGNWVWASSPFDGGGRMTVTIATPGVHAIGIARREDGAFLDKFALSTDPNFSPTTGFGALGPPVTRRQGQPLPPDTVDFQITTHPVDVAGPENGSVSLTVAASIPPGQLFTYQWQRQQGGSFVDVPAATLPTFTLNPLTSDWSGAVLRARVTVSGVAKFSNTATVTVSSETEAPRLVHLDARATPPSVTVVFSEAVTTASAQNPANYRIDGPAGTLAVNSATLLPGGRVAVLETGAQSAGTKYTLTVNGVADTAARPNVMMNVQARFYSGGALLPQTAVGLIVVEAEAFDRNPDGLWSVDRLRGTPSGGASAVNYNGAGGSETATKIEFDVEFTRTGTHTLWYRVSSDSGNDDSIWFHFDGDRPPERASGNRASMSGFNGLLEFVWRSNPQEGGGRMTFDVPTTGAHVVAFARREDGAFIDKFAIATDPAFNPDDYGPFGPPETRQGIPPLPAIAITEPVSNTEFPGGASVPITVEVGATTRVISRIEVLTGTNVVGEATGSPYRFTWANPPVGTNVITARLTDDTLATIRSAPVSIVVAGSQPILVTATAGAAGLTLSWTGGAAPYRVQAKTALAEADWTDVLTTTETTAAVPISGAARFFRVASP